MVIFDSNVYISAFNKEDSNHKQGLNLLKTEKGKIYISELILSEVTTFFTYKFSKEIAKRIMQFILEDKRIVFVEAPLQKTIEIWNIINANIGYTDVAIITIALEYNLELISFDKQMLGVYKKIIL